MANRKDYYFRQKVTDTELDAGFTGLEDADRNLAIDFALLGIASGLVVTQHTPNNLTVDVTAGVAYDVAGQRVRVPSTQNVSVALDNGGVTTDVATPGNSKVVSLFVKFKRVLSDPRVDGNSATVYFDQTESFEFFVKQGTEAVTGTEAPPALEGDKLLIADIRRTNGVTTIVNAAIQPYVTNRRQDTFVVAGTPYDLREGTVKDAIEEVLTISNAVAADMAAVNAHLVDAVDAHDATAISTTAEAVPFVGAPFALAGAEVDAQLAELLGFVNADYRWRALGVAATLDDGGFRDKTIVLTAGSFTLSLTDPATNAGRTIMILDKTGALGVGTEVTLGRFAAEKIDDLAANFLLDVPYGRWLLWCDGTDWYLFNG